MSGGPPLRVVETALRVRYAETDRMGIVYHANYIVWFEIGRTEYCRAAGLPYRAMEDAGLLILVTGVECRYRRSARYDDAIRVRARMTELSSRGLAFSYDVLGAGGARLADGATRHVFADTAGRPRRAPPDMVTALEALVLRKLRVPREPGRSGTPDAQRSTLNAQHVSTARKLLKRFRRISRGSNT